MLKRIAVFAVAAVGLTAAPVAAQQYPPDEITVAASDTTPCPGDAVTLTGTVTGQNFPPGSTVVLTQDGTTELGTVTSDGDGDFSLEITIPVDATGTHTITATSTGLEGRTVTFDTSFEVVDCDVTTTTVPGGALPETGSNSTMPLVRAGVALAALGGVLLAVAAKRRRRHALAV